MISLDLIPTILLNGFFTAIPCGSVVWDEANKRTAIGTTPH